MSKKLHCPQCGEVLTPNHEQKVQCLVCGWGIPGVDVSSKRSGLIGYFVKKSVRWRILAVSSVIIFGLVLPSGILFPINQFRVNKAIAKAQSQMSNRLYASAARTIHEAPRSLVPATQLREMRTLLSDNIRWGRDISDVKRAKISLVDDEPDLALDNLDDIDNDFPHEDEALELVDSAQDLTFDPSLDLDQADVDEIAFTPDDPEADGLDDLDNNLGDDLPSDPEIPSDPTAQPAQAPTTPGQPPATPAIYDDELDLGLEDILSPSDEAELNASDEGLEGDPPEDQISDPNDLDSIPGIPQPARSTKPKLKDFQHLTKDGITDNLLTIDITNEINPKRDRKSGVGGYSYHATQGKIYNKKVKKYAKRIIPLYRYYSAARTDHYYTTKGNFASSSSNYKRQLVAGYIGKWSTRSNKCLAGKIPLYNVWHRASTTNYATTDAGYKDKLLREGWSNPIIIGCVW